MEKTRTYKTFGSCARFIDIVLDEGKISEVRFIGGCSGNTQGISSLARGMSAEDVMERFRGIQCRGGTSCPDQLSRALEEILLQKDSREAS